MNCEYETKVVGITLTPSQDESRHSFKYAPITSYDLARSFIRHKFVTRSDCRSFVK